MLFSAELILPQQIALQTNQSAAQAAQQESPAIISSVRVTPDGIIFRTTASKLRALASYLKGTTMFQLKSSTEVATVDRLLPNGRFVVNYLLSSRKLNQRASIQLSVSETDTIPTLTLGVRKKDEPIFPAANSHEREV